MKEPKHVHLRHKLEAYHGHQDPAAVQVVWPYLNIADRYIRFAARVALEHQDPKIWQAKALSEKDPSTALAALLALVRATGQDPFHHPRKATDPVPGEMLRGAILDALGRIDWAALTTTQRLDMLRVYHVLFNRMGPPDEPRRQKLIARFDAASSRQGTRIERGTLSAARLPRSIPTSWPKTLKLLSEAPTQEEQLEYARSLRVLKNGWTMEQRKEYFTWFLKAAKFKGGNSMNGFLNIMKGDAVATLTAKEKEDLKPILEAKPLTSTPIVGTPRAFVKKWKLDDLAPLVEKGLVKRDFDRGRKLFGEAKCFVCHRYDNEGGSNGPDLTIASGRYQRPRPIGKAARPEQGDQRPVFGGYHHDLRWQSHGRTDRELPHRQYVGHDQYARPERPGEREREESRIDRKVEDLDDAPRPAGHDERG